MLSVRLTSRCFFATTKGFSSTVHGNVFRLQVSGKSNKISVIKRPYQTKSNAWRTWDAVEKPAGITGTTIFKERLCQAQAANFT